MEAIKTAGDIKRQNRLRIARYFMQHASASRQELAAALKLSMPTVFQNVNDLMGLGLLCESGEYGSTGGRKAKVLTINEGFRCVTGVEISQNHVRLVLMDLCGKLLDVQHFHCVYEHTQAYYEQLGKWIEQLLLRNGLAEKLLGVGLSLPGIIDQQRGILRRSHTLGIADIPIRQFTQFIPYPICYDNDANHAAYAEVQSLQTNLVYLSLNDTVGGAIYLNGQIYQGDHCKSAELGHVILHPNGRRCYCGKAGCMDAYCSAKVLQCDGDETLDHFFEQLQNGDPRHIRQWETYRNDLALAISNIRMQLDCNILLGGYVGGYLADYLCEFEEAIRQYNNFDQNIAYLSGGHYRKECSALGAARHMADVALETLLSV